MNKYKLECWYRYAGANEKEFLTVEVKAKNLEEAIEIARVENSDLLFFKIECKMCVPVVVLEKLQHLIHLAQVTENLYAQKKLKEIKKLL
jgi:hypothetical protein